MPLPAPLWRRLAAAVYDGLLLLALWMVALLVDTVVRDLLGVDRSWVGLRAYLFVLGLVFFGWFWTHGGQTLGMRAWRLQLRRADGSPPRWLDAALRYAMMLLAWATVLTPALMRLPLLAALPQADRITVAALLLTAAGCAWTLLDGRRRAPQDRASGTEVVQLAPGRSAAQG